MFGSENGCYVLAKVTYGLCRENNKKKKKFHFMKLLLLFITECIIWIENVILLLSRQQNFMRILSTYIHKMTYIIIY